MDNWQDKNDNTARFDHNFENIVVTHDLQDCFDESFDLCFNKVYEQLPVINYTKLSEEKEKPENAVYIGKLPENEENSG